ncbi:MAG: hypothetical protein EA409_06380 [Saprospirales bacterium]|nr:MAG: hypothetical protein EA409_06380 [Saprospirales bacterium]
MFFRRVYIRGIEKVDVDRPSIFAVNHPSAFLEPTLIATHVSFPVHFLTRGDVFNRKFLWFFNATNQVPVFRFKDGFNQLRNNQDSFERCYSKLLDGAKLLIFCEGSMKWIKRMRGVQPGAAKLAFGTLELRSDLPLVIHPVGVNYDDHTRFRSDVMVEIGDPVEVATFWEEYNVNGRSAIKALTAEVHKGLANSVLHIERDEDLKRGALLWDVVKNDFLAGGRMKQIFSNPFTAVDAALECLNDRSDIKAYSDIKNTIDEYAELADCQGIRDDQVIRLKSGKKVPGALLELILMPFALLNGPPLLFATFVSRIATPSVEFYSSVRMVLFTLFYTFYLLLLPFVFVLLSINWWYFVFIPIGGWLYLQVRGYFNVFIKSLLMPKNTKDKLHERRNKILDYFGTFGREKIS